MIDGVMDLLGAKRWYGLFEQIKDNFITAEAGESALKIKSQLEGLVKKNELVVANWDGAIYDSEKKCLRVCGFLPTQDGSIFQGKLAGTTMVWEFGSEQMGMEEMIALAKQRLEQDEVNIFMHGHSGDAIDMFQAVQAKREEDAKDEVMSVQLSLGLMGGRWDLFVEPGG